MITPHDSAVVGAFFIDGLEIDGKLLAAWDKNYYELVYEITRYAEYCWKLGEAGGEVTGGDFPGVYAYEVSSAFGGWFHNRVLATGEAPAQSECVSKLLKLASDFFERSQTDYDKLIKALGDVKAAA
jgi:hypothetical protein